jgi:hypothetical protein
MAAKKSQSFSLFFLLLSSSYLASLDCLSVPSFLSSSKIEDSTTDQKKTENIYNDISDQYYRNNNNNNNNQINNKNDVLVAKKNDLSVTALLDNDIDDSSEFYDPFADSFFDFAEKKVVNEKIVNKEQFKKLLDICPYTPLTSLTQNDNNSNSLTIPEVNLAESDCVNGVYSLEKYGPFNGKIFLIDSKTIGVLNSVDQKLRIFSFDNEEKKLSLVRIKRFHQEVPTDACVDSNNDIYVVFPKQNKISKFKMIKRIVTISNDQEDFFLHPSMKKRVHIILKEVIKLKKYQIIYKIFYLIF